MILMGNKSAKYLPLTSPLLPSDDSEACKQGSYRDDRSKHNTWHILAMREKMLIIIIILQTIALIVAIIFNKDCGSSTIPCRCPSTDGMLLYYFTKFEVPVQSEAEYKIKLFTPGREHKTIYQGASKEVDRAWGELYNYTLLKILKSEAALLPNKMYPIKHEPGYYLPGLDVFHQLHCLWCCTILEIVFIAPKMRNQLVFPAKFGTLERLDYNFPTTTRMNMNFYLWPLCRDHP
ncbi:uncharacterized protein LACBIDRAFT_325145 [Laccaria bicolor S238N-H82]|uniref:Predicted protein n=1 Tax=Laccaria bicolor (strain S238N-H82 / ATCC MYA-4686) TaxID=486041 RepID=B0D5B1_LACBS|nr:uncharacterized protein LACBIDRAFT_325145 [Laccaria bicolor S238N-H82]EDR10490.1 predicted protein [Laccaria bicolor S238N-H82]|eukprot:XP_001878940.1 predicted protein [Laccaria bicolor S238N-H82]